MMGRPLDLDDPQHFTEKIQYYRLFYDHPDFPRICDKADFKEYIAEKIGQGYTAKLYGVWDDVNKINIDSLPEQFVLKSNCSSFGKGIILVTDKSSFDFEKIKPELKKWLKKQNIDTYVNISYRKVKPRILAEEYLPSEGGLIDYKFFCFHGKPYCAYTAIEHFAHGKAVHSKISFYNLDWEPMDVKYGVSERCDLPKPKHYDEMLKFSRILSADFPFVRVDFYDTEEQLYVGELTFYPGGGYTRFKPRTFDMKLGKQFDLPDDNVSIFRRKRHRDSI